MGNYKAAYHITGEEGSIYKDFSAKDGGQALDFAEFEAIAIAVTRGINPGRVTLTELVRLDGAKLSEQIPQPRNYDRPLL